MGEHFYDFRDPKAVENFKDSKFWRLGDIPQPSVDRRGQTLQWFQSDSEENYLKQGNHSYSRDSISYRFNQFGYRSDEFALLEHYDPEEFRAMFVGDSNVLGIGSPWEELWTTQLCQKLHRYTGRFTRQLNLGWGGTGSDWVSMITRQTLDLLRPNVLFVLYSMVGRRNYFASSTQLYPFLPRMNFQKEFEKEYEALVRLTNPYDSFFRFAGNAALVEVEAKNRSIPLIWTTLEHFPREFLSRYLDTRGYIGAYPSIPIKARDGIHAGAPTQTELAELAYQRYQELTCG